MWPPSPIVVAAQGEDAVGGRGADQKVAAVPTRLTSLPWQLMRS
jgi:hypothetical protein